MFALFQALYVAQEWLAMPWPILQVLAPETEQDPARLGAVKPPKPAWLLQQKNKQCIIYWVPNKAR